MTPATFATVDRSTDEVTHTEPSQNDEEAIREAFDTAFHLTGVAQYLEYYECS